MAVDVTVYGSGNNTSMCRATPSTNWDTVHDAAGARVYDPIHFGGAGENTLISNVSKSAAGGYSIYRSFLYFDLSDIAVGSELGTVQLHLYVIYKPGAAPATPHPGDLYITQGVQDDPVSTYPDPCYFDSAPRCSSYNFGDQLPYTTSWGYIPHNDVVLNQYNIITLNAVGKAALNLGGLQKFCMRVYYDLIDNPPLALGEADSVQYYSQEEGGDYRPKLVFGEVYKKVYPTADLTRVTAIRHIYRPGLFRMEVTLGDVQNAIDMIDTKVRTEVGAPLGEVIGPPSSEWLQDRLRALGIPYPKEQPPTYPIYTPPAPPQYTPEVPQPPISYPQYPSYYTPEVPQRPPPVPPIQPSPLDVFRERMWKFMEDPLTAITETWKEIKWW